MVHTRKSFENLSSSPRSRTHVPSKVKKKVQIHEDRSRDRDDIEKAPISSTRHFHLRYDNKPKASHSSSKSKPNGLCRTRNSRSKPVIQEGIVKLTSLEKPVSKSCSKKVVKSRTTRRRHSLDEEFKLKLMEPSSIRRSSRQRRGVYETLNVKMLTDHRYVHTYDSALIADKEKQKKGKKDCHELVEEFFENDNPINMYDHVKRRHETPTPEKVHNVEEGDGDDEGDEDNDDEHESEQDNSDEEEEEEEAEEHQENKYLLRKKKPVVNRYMAPPMRKTGEKKNYLSVRSKMYHKPPPHASPVRQIRHKRKAINMSSSTSSSEDSSIEKDEKRFERRKKMSTAKARLRALPVNLTIDDISQGILKDRERIGSSLADVDPMSIDKKVHFDSVGGLRKQVRGLKEMILFPLMYPEVFGKFKINPPRGVLFYGPPGTGKTLVARALANECSLGNQKIAFFMRKGADCLSKWVGESERQLRLLFDQAYSMRPSIIFFDEIDGLAPVRSSRQDQIHSSIVSTLLALMDGLDSRGEVVVIGATNRIDAIDPALRRPGRFDREFQFPLPDVEARRAILSIHTREWEPRLSQTFIDKLAEHCVGYCGADIKALCTEAAMFALRRCYPQVYSSSKKLLLDVNSIEVTFKDFLRATKSIVPACQRSVGSPARALSEIIKPLLCNLFQKALNRLGTIFPPANSKRFMASSSSQATNAGLSRDDRLKAIDDDCLSSDDDDFPSIHDRSITYSASTSSRSERYMRRIKQRYEPPNEDDPCNQKLFNFSDEIFKDAVTYRPRLLLAGQDGAGQTLHLAPALLHSMEHLSVHSLDLPALYGVAARTPEEACSQLFREARRSMPSVIYMPHVHSLWNSTNESLHATMLSLLQDLPPLCPILLLATTEKKFYQLPAELKRLFSTQTEQVLHADLPNSEERKAFFEKLFLVFSLQTIKVKKHRKQSLEVLPLAPLAPARQLSESELKKIKLNEENTLLELRIFLRDVHHKLYTDRRFKEFTKAVDLEEVPDYLDVVSEPMDLSTMMQKIDCHQYNTCGQYLLDVDLITTNALKYNPNVDPLDKIIRHRACELRDTAHSLIKSQLEPEFEKACEEIIKAREKRGETSDIPQMFLPHPSTSTKNYPDSTVSKPSASPVIADNQITSTLASSSTTIDSGSQPSLELKKKRRRKRSYWFGKRYSGKKKNLTVEIEKLVVVDNKCDVKEAGNCEQNSGITSIHSGGKSSSISSNDHQNDDNINGSSSSLSLETQTGITSVSSHDPQNRKRDVHSHEPQNGSTDTSGESFVSSHTSGKDKFLDSSKSNNATMTQSNAFSYEEPHTQDVPIMDLSNEDSSGGPKELLQMDDKSSEQAPDSSPNARAATEETVIQDKDNQENDEPQREAIRSHSIETLEKWKGELQSLLDEIVDMTEGCNVEMLEIYHNRLQLSAHRYRNVADKSRLIKDFSDLIAQWQNGMVT